MKRLTVLTVVVIAVLTGGLAIYLFWVGTLLNRIADNLEDSADLVQNIDDNAKVIRPGLAHINEVGRVVAGALPLLYGMAEQVVRSVAGKPATSTAPDAAAPDTAARDAAARDAAAPDAAGTARTRRSRQHDGVGFIPPG